MPNTEPAPGNAVNPHSEVIALAKRVVTEDDPAVQHDLYRLVTRGMRVLIARDIGERDVVGTVVQQAFESVIRALKSGSLQPDAVLTGVRYAVRVAVHDQRNIGAANLRSTISTQDLQGWVRSLSTRDREVLIRFYVEGQGREVIQESMGLLRPEFDEIRNRTIALLPKHRMRKPLTWKGRGIR
jgi:hypothetical protein